MARRRCKNPHGGVNLRYDGLLFSGKHFCRKFIISSKLASKFNAPGRPIKKPAVQCDTPSREPCQQCCNDDAVPLIIGLANGIFLKENRGNFSRGPLDHAASAPAKRVQNIFAFFGYWLNGRRMLTV